MQSTDFLKTGKIIEVTRSNILLTSWGFKLSAQNSCFGRVAPHHERFHLFQATFDKNATFQSQTKASQKKHLIGKSPSLPSKILGTIQQKTTVGLDISLGLCLKYHALSTHFRTKLRLGAVNNLRQCSVNPPDHFSANLMQIFIPNMHAKRHGVCGSLNISVPGTSGNDCGFGSLVLRRRSGVWI